jgi:hypothetical protein
MRSGRRQPPNHRLANIQMRRSALLSRGRGYRRCSTSNCCRKQRFSAINRAFGLNIAAMAHSRSRNSRSSGRSSASRSDSPATCQRQRGRWLFLHPSGELGRSTLLRVLERVCRELKIEASSVHGFRSTFSDWVSDCTDFDEECYSACNFGSDSLLMKFRILPGGVLGESPSCRKPFDPAHLSRSDSWWRAPSAIARPR